MSDLDILADAMHARGVTGIFGIPGSGASLTLIDALEKRGIPFHLNHFEGSGVLMAGAVGRLSGKTGVAVGIKGPGLANMLPGIAACRLEAFPVVTLSEAYLPGTPSHKAHKRLEHQALISGSAKGRRFFSVNGPGFSDLAEWSEKEVPGPVHMDFSASPLDYDDPVPDEISLTASSGIEPDEISEIVSGSKRPVIIAGTYAVREKISARLNRLSVPSFSVAAAKGVIDETLPHAAGVYTGAGLTLAPEFSILPEADLVIGIGLRHNEVLNVKSFECRSINCDPLGEAFCGGFDFERVFDGSSRNLEALFLGLERKSWGQEELSGRTHTLMGHMLRAPFMPAGVFHMIERHFDHQARVILDTGNFCTIGEHTLKVRRPENYLSAGQGRYMGIGLPLSIGASLYDPEIPTILFSGDGGIGMFVAEMKLAVRHRLPLIVVLMSDGYLGSIRVRSLSDGITEKPVSIHQPSWRKVFQAFGVQSVTVDSESGIEEALNCWEREKGPLFLEACFDPDNYQRMVDGIR